MKITVSPGSYIVAVSGGVDSMVLLDLLAKQRAEHKTQGKEKQTHSSAHTPLPLMLIVAHFDHGIRPDSDDDRLFVEHAAKTYGLPFVFDRGNLGPNSSEERARKARYAFLEAARRSVGASAVITAHHLDDRIETAIINSLRGTGRRGLTSLRNRPTMIRPLLGTAKSELIDYARTNGIGWREDSTNSDTRYLRNHVRHKLLPALDSSSKDALIQNLTGLLETNDEIDRLLANLLHVQPASGQLSRQWFIMLPHRVATEIMLAWLRAHNVGELNKKQLILLTTKAKTLSPGKSLAVTPTCFIKIGKHKLALTVAER